MSDKNAVMLIESFEGWTLTKQDAHADTYASTWGYRCLLVIPSALRNKIHDGCSVTVSIGWHWDRRGNYSVAIPEFKGLKHTKITAREIAHKPHEISLKTVVRDQRTPRGKQQAIGQGRKSKLDDPIPLTTRIEKELARELDQYCKDAGKYRITVVNEAIEFFLKHQETFNNLKEQAEAVAAARGASSGDNDFGGIEEESEALRETSYKEEQLADDVLYMFGL